MQKKELWFIHDLLRHVQEHIEATEDTEIALPTYENAPTMNPFDTKINKAQHQEAVAALLEDITTHIEENETTVSGILTA